MTTHPYIEYGGLTSVPGPFRCEADVSLFWLNADAKTVEASCAQVLGPKRFRPVGDLVMLTFGSMKITSTCTETSPLFEVPYNEMGSSSERHAALWILLLDESPTRRIDWIDHVTAFVPAMWVDNPVSLLGGREIYGIDKQWGELTIPPDGGEYSLQVIGGQFSRGASAVKTTLLNLKPLDGHLHEIDTAVHEIGQSMANALSMIPNFVRSLGHGALTIPRLSKLINDLDQRQLRQICVRQFRNPLDNGFSASEEPELVELSSTFSKVSVSEELRTYDFALTQLASHPLQRILGVRPSQKLYGRWRIAADFVLGTSA